MAALTDGQVSVVFERDTRTGFINHPVMTVSWCLTTCKFPNSQLKNNGSCNTVLFVV